MSRNAYTLAVLRWPQAQLVHAAAEESESLTARHILNNLFDNDQHEFAMYSSFMDGWNHTEDVFSIEPEESLFCLLGARQLLYNLVLFHPNEAATSRKLWKTYKKRAAKPLKHCLGKYALESMFHWLNVGFGFMQSTGLPMLVAYDTIGGTLGDEEFRVGVAPQEFSSLEEAIAASTRRRPHA